MNIGIITGGIHPTSVGGAEKQAIQLANFLSKRNNVTVYTRFHRDNPNFDNFNLDQVKFFNIPVLRYFQVIIGTFY